MLENEDEREEVDEPFHAEHPLAPFLRPPLPPPELRPLPRLLDQSCSLGGALSHTSIRCASPASTTAVTNAAAVVVATPTVFVATPTVSVPAVATVAASLFPPVAFPQLFLQDSAKRQGREPRRGPSAGP